MPGPLDYPNFHNYPKPIDYVRVTTTKRTHFVFDSDTIAGAVRIYLGYQYGPFLETWQRPDSSVVGVLQQSPLDVAPPVYATEHGTWGGHLSWGITSNQAYIAQPSSTWGGWQSQFLLVWTDLADIDISTNVSTTAGGNAGLIVRSDRNGIGLAYFLNPTLGKVQFSQLFNYTSNGNNVLFTGSTSISAGVTYTLRVVAVGDDFSLYLNGNLEGTFNTSYSNTRISHGLWATSTGARFPAPFQIVRAALPVATTYTVRNYDGDIVATGSITDDHIDLADSVLRWRGHGPYGWYRVYLTGPDHNDNQWQTAYGDIAFYRVRTDANFAANVGVSVPTAGEPGTDEYARAVMGGLGPTRLELSSVNSPANVATNGNNAAVTQVANYLATNVVNLAYPTRPRTLIGAFGDGTAGIASTITATVNMLKNVIKTWEPRNEPQYGSSGEAYVTNEFDYFRNAVKAADPNGRVIGPGVVQFNNGGPDPATGQPLSVNSFVQFVDTFVAACMSRGGTAYLDGVSVHAYNCFNGDISLGRRCMAYLKNIMTTRGYTGPIYQTEQGFQHYSNGRQTPRHAGRWTMNMWLLCELYGIPIENNFYWYDPAHFDQVPMQWLDFRQGPGPQTLPIRVMQAELGNRTFTAQFDFGTYGNQMYAGGTWTGADGTKLVGLMAGSFGATNLLLTVTGTTSLTCVDPWGNTFTLAASGGSATFPISEMPQWIRCPVGVTVTPAPLGLNTNLAVTSTPSTTGNQALIARISDGIIQNGFEGEAVTRYKDNSNVLPQTFTLDWGAPVTANRVVVYCFPPWQVSGTFSDFDVDTFDGSVWTTRLHHPLPPLQTFPFTSSGRCIFEQFWDEQYVFDVAFPAASITKLRIVVRKVTYGDTDHPTLKNDIYGDAYAYQEVYLPDVQVFGTGAPPPPPPPPPSTLRNPAMGGVTR